MTPPHRGRSHWREKRRPFLEPVKQLYEQGLGITETARELGLSYHFTKSCLADLGLTSYTAEQVKARRIVKTVATKKKQRERLWPEVRAGYDAGETVLHMANRLGVGRKKIMTCLDDLGLAPRTVSETNMLRFQRMTPEERKQLAAAAHKVSRRNGLAESQMRNNAKSNQATKRYIGEFEAEVAEYPMMLLRRCPKFLGRHKD